MEASLTICADTGAVLTETLDGVTMPADYSFASVNDYVHSTERHFEELQYLALDMANEIDKLRKRLVEALKANEPLRLKAVIADMSMSEIEEHLKQQLAAMKAYNATRTDELLAATRRIAELEAALAKVSAVRWAAGFDPWRQQREGWKCLT